MKVKEESERVGLKLNIQKLRSWPFGLITSWKIDGGNSDRLNLGGGMGSRITVDGNCSHKIKRHGRKAMNNLDSILKSRDITLPIKVCLVKATVFPVVMYGCESWTLKKAELKN